MQVILLVFAGAGASVWKSGVDGQYDALCPGALGLLIHTILEHDLHEAVDTQYLRVLVLLAPHQRIFEQHPKGFVELEWIDDLGSRIGTRFGHTSQKQLFRDGIRSQERAEAQHIGGSGTLLLDPLKRERPGSGHRVRIVEYEAAISRQQCFAMYRVKAQISLQAAARLLYVSAGLDNRQRQPIHLLNDAFGSGTIRGPCLLERSIPVQSFAPA